MSKEEVGIEDCMAAAGYPTAQQKTNGGGNGTGDDQQHSGAATAPEPKQTNGNGQAAELRVLHSIPTPEPPKYVSVGNFTMTANGLKATVTKGSKSNQTIETIDIADAFEIIELARNPRGEGWGKCLRWKDRDTRTHTYSVSDALLQSDAGIVAAELANRGLTVFDKNRLVEYLKRVNVTARVTTVPHTGWYDTEYNCFVLPDRTIGGAANEAVILDGGLNENSPFATHGTLKEWQNNVGKLVAGHTLPTFLVSASFAGPLLEPCGIESGGVHVYGPSTTGKTTAMCASASSWGRGIKQSGFVQTWRATANALEATAALHTDTVLPLDEIGEAEPRDVASAAYSLSGGKGKGRARRDGSLRQPASWRVFVLSNGEIRLGDKLNEAGKRSRAGQEVRLLEISADAGHGCGVFDSPGATGNVGELADKLRDAASKYYGTAGPEFIRQLIVAGTLKCAAEVEQQVEQFVSNVPEGADAQVRRAAMRFGLVAAAGELAIKLGVVPWPKGSSIEAAKKCFEAWIEARGGIEAHEVRQAIEQVATYITMHGASRFEPIHGDQDRVVHNRAGWWRGDGDQRQWVIPPETWRAEVCAGLSPSFVADTLAKLGMLLKDASGKLSRSETIQGKSRRVYVVTSDIFSATDYQKTGVVGVKGVARCPSDAKTSAKITTYGGHTGSPSDHTSRREGVVPVWPEKSSNFSGDSTGATPVTPATQQSNMAGEERPKCVQCQGAPDGNEIAYTINGATIWLHPQCKRFWGIQQ
jgi:uncharacterized protein (DUF927 family)